MGAEQELFPLDDGSALLLTTARYAAPSGKVFMTEGVSPTVEVKRVDVVDVSATDDNEGDPQATAPRQPRPPATGEPQTPAAPPVVVAPKPADDLMLKKAIEVLTSGSNVKRRAA